MSASSEPAAERARQMERVVTLVAWAAVVGLGLWSGWQRWLVMESSPYPLGVDGYYYPLQLRGLLERGVLAYPASPLAFWLMWPLAALTDPVTGAKLGAVLGGAAVVVPAFLVGRRLGGVAGGLAAAVAAVATGGSFYLSFEFVKNGVGLTLALTAVWLALRALERPAAGRLALAVAAAVATALTHKLAFAVLAVLVAPALLVAAGRRAVVVVAAAALAAVVLGVAMPERFAGERELALVAEAFSADAEWSLPALVIDRGPGNEPVRVTLGHQAAVAAVVTLALLVVLVASFPGVPERRREAPKSKGSQPALRLRPRFARPTLSANGNRGACDLNRGSSSPGASGGASAAEGAVVWAAVALIALAALPWLAVRDPDGLGFRLRSSAFAPLAIVAAALVGRAAALARLGPHAALLATVPALAAWLAVRPAAPTDGLVRAHPAMVAALRAADGALPAGAVVVTAERHLGFQLAWYARVPVRMRPGPAASERLWRMLPGNLLGFGSPLDRALDEASATPGVAPPLRLHPRHPSGLVLVPEATWRWALARLPPADAVRWALWPTL